MKNLPQELNFNHWISVLLFLEIQSVIFDEISLPDLSVAECSIKNANHSFQVRRYYSKSYISNDSTTPVFFHPSIRLPFTSSTIFFFLLRIYMCCVCVPALYTQLRTLAMGLFPSRCAHQPPDHCSNSYRTSLNPFENQGGGRNTRSTKPKRPGSLRPVSLCLCLVSMRFFFLI